MGVGVVTGAGTGWAGTVREQGRSGREETYANGIQALWIWRWRSSPPRGCQPGAAPPCRRRRQPPHGYRIMWTGMAMLCIVSSAQMPSSFAGAAFTAAKCRRPLRESFSCPLTHIKGSVG